MIEKSLLGLTNRMSVYFIILFWIGLSNPVFFKIATFQWSWISQVHFSSKWEHEYTQLSLQSPEKAKWPIGYRVCDFGLNLFIHQLIFIEHLCAIYCFSSKKQNTKCSGPQKSYILLGSVRGREGGADNIQERSEY